MRHNVREHGHLTHLDILVRASLKQRLHYVQMSTVCRQMQRSIALATTPLVGIWLCIESATHVVVRIIDVCLWMCLQVPH